ncbi:fungal-specific transcription factor domain-containing protein [Mycena rebaudengoi]|nr:fungal-specific transcription factor domain-containing protein [Mycena rebaudengoi]
MAAWPAGAPYTLPPFEYPAEDDPDHDEDHDDYEPSSGRKGKDKTVRRRSSKACDQCRKSKCKCERTAPGEPCRSCVMLGTECTFLGPSRKRGPPKGYIDAIEARLHQTEALVGILLAAASSHIDDDSADDAVDDRARGLLADLGEDPLAREILARIDQSAYGVTGRATLAAAAANSNSNSSSIIAHPSSTNANTSSSSTNANPASANPNVNVNVNVNVNAKNSNASAANTKNGNNNTNNAANARTPSSTRSGSPGGGGSAPGNPGIGVNGTATTGTAAAGTTTAASAARATRRRAEAFPRAHEQLAHEPPIQSARRDDDGMDVGTTAGRGEGGLAGAVGQLSLNEDKQVRYHGKVSGLHLLARQAGARGRRGRSEDAGVAEEDGAAEEERGEGRNVGGIWRFPKARVWPPAPPSPSPHVGTEGDGEDMLPDRAAQEELLARYFAYVHPGFPVVYKRAVLDGFTRDGRQVDCSISFQDHYSHCTLLRPQAGHRGRTPALLLLAMYALAARYEPSPSPKKYMWPAGDAFLDRAKVLLDSSYASSRPSTCQALLLMGYREIGIGAMAQAWIYIGMAVRMAQDLGMQRDADGWVRAGGRGGKLFGEWEIAERRRIWYACVIMDKYVSTYIGRPLAIFERDFDTSLPNESDPEELEHWAPLSSDCLVAPAAVSSHPRAGHVLSCFNASAKLSGILSHIVQSIYAIRPASSRHAELVVIDELLDKWNLHLPEHLQYDPAAKQAVVPLPHVLTLHMQYWCAVLLLHRPHSPAGDDTEWRANAEKSYELCVAAANHITTIATVYSEKYSLKYCAVFLCYYIFTASIMHVTTLSAYPSDPQARVGLTKCMDALRMMEIVWPSAARALELLRGSQANLEEADRDRALPVLHPGRRARKRSADTSLDDSFERTPLPAVDYIGLRTDQRFAPAAYAVNGHYQPQALAVEVPRSEVSSFYTQSPTYERWPGDVSTLAFQGALSTSVMGPAYSTGLADERQRTHSDAHRGAEPRFPQQQGQGQGQQQYWNEYTAFTPLATAHDPYGGMHDERAHHPEAQMYQLPEQYDLYPQ